MNLFIITPIKTVGFINGQMLFVSYNYEAIVNLNHLTSICKRADYGYSLNLGGESYWITDEDYERIMKELN